MATLKINLEKGQHYTGSKGQGQVQKDLLKVVEMLLNTESLVLPTQNNTHETITFRCDDTVIELLHEIADSNNLSLQKLLRIGMEQSNLIAY